MLSKIRRPSRTACDDGGEVVVQQHQAGGLAGHVRAAPAHGDADVGGLQGRGVVDAVAGHGHDLAVGLEGVDDPQLLLRARRGRRCSAVPMRVAGAPRRPSDPAPGR